MTIKTFILLPAYNEDKVIGKVIVSVKKESWKNIIVVDDKIWLLL